MAEQSRNQLSGLTWAEALEACRSYQQPLLGLLGVKSSAQFVIKSAFMSHEVGMRVVGLFKDDLALKRDLYLEIIGRDWKPADDARTLYRWKYNPHAAEEYHQTTIGSYLVPFDELEAINPIEATEFGSQSMFAAEEDLAVAAPPRLSTRNLTTAKPALVRENFQRAQLLDRKVSDLTLRELIALVHKRPTGTSPELDKLISEL